MDFRLNDVRDLVILRALQSFELLLDTKDYVPPLYFEKIQKYTFKLFKKQYKRAVSWARKIEPEQPPEEKPEQPQTPAVPVLTADVIKPRDILQSPTEEK